MGWVGEGVESVLVCRRVREQRRMTPQVITPWERWWEGVRRWSAPPRLVPPFFLPLYLRVSCLSLPLTSFPLRWLTLPLFPYYYSYILSALFSGFFLSFSSFCHLHILQDAFILTYQPAFLFMLFSSIIPFSFIPWLPLHTLHYVFIFIHSPHISFIAVYVCIVSSPAFKTSLNHLEFTCILVYLTWSRHFCQHSISFQHLFPLSLVVCKLQRQRKFHLLNFRRASSFILAHVLQTRDKKNLIKLM